MTTLSGASGPQTVSSRPSVKAPIREEFLVAFRLENVVEGTSFPITCGIPLPINAIFSAQQLLLKDVSGQQVVAQFEPLAHWPNGSVKAVRAHWIGNQHAYELYHQKGVIIDASSGGDRETPADKSPLTIEGHGLQITHPTFGGLSLELKLGTEQGKEFHPQWAEVQTCANGPVCMMIELHGRYSAITNLRVRLRLSLYKASPHIHASVRLQNARRARHQGGLWDLGDPNSIYFKSFEMITRRPDPHRIRAQFESATCWKGPFDQFQIYQDSSGGDNWKSINHLDREGRVPCQFRGYQATSKNEQVGEGLRATPTVVLEGEQIGRAHV